MNRPILVSLAGVSLLALAACGEGEKKSEAEPAPPAQTQSAPADTGQTGAAPADTAPADAAPAGAAPDAAPADTAPAQTAPADDQTMAPDGADINQAIGETQDTVHEAAASMTDEQKQGIIAAARAHAEAAAREAGGSEAEIKLVGDQVEASTKRKLGVE